MRTARVAASYCVLAVMLLLAASGPANEFSPPARKFHFTYQVTLKQLPTGAQSLRVWIPLAVSDRNQTVNRVGATGPIHWRETHEARFGNRMLYGDLRRPASPVQFSVEYEVTRREYSRGTYELLNRTAAGSLPRSKELDQFLQPDQLVPTSGRIKEMADEQTRGKEGSLAKVRALYDYVFQTVRYDKSGTGWGRGDSLWVCDARHGNCTDFHSLFISMARAEGIPARFEIGFPVPGAPEGTIPGYHCWAEFFAPGVGWVPVDISEAWKDPKKHDYFFGSLDANRVQFTIGRDLALEPRQSGAPLNYFIYPYVEVDGKPFDGIEKAFKYREATRGKG